MSTMRLIRTSGPLIPGGFQFNDPITGKSYRDQHSLFEQRVSQIINDRRANARLWTDPNTVNPEHVARLLSEQNCQRLKNSNRFCSDGTVQVNSAQPLNAVTHSPAPTGKTCKWCRGSNLTEVLCQTCGGRKVVAYKCQDCKKETPVR